ncbi:UNKNOWN [Stylonychia lemnae]|uniref:Uncharacterized protein n=1 Tax=Stylonychia lemnae TaxID=5949 RepID=A0A078AW69_STYLE|nr:UNKNOWN [Stylonychia lemnae]|eukprot:CDW86715.1 UNKNOWN [Stylonychia lemnae]
MPADTKKYLVHDIVVLVILIILFFINRSAIPATASSGVKTLHLVEYIISWVIQIVLVVFDYLNLPNQVGAMRSSALIYLIGVFAVTIKMGVFNIWFILFFFALLPYQLILWVDTAEMVNGEEKELNHDESHQPFIDRDQSNQPFTYQRTFIRQETQLDNPVIISQQEKILQDIAAQRAAFFQQQRSLPVGQVDNNNEGANNA